MVLKSMVKPCLKKEIIPSLCAVTGRRINALRRKECLTKG